MTDTPTTWRITPAGATEEMIEAGVQALWPNSDNRDVNEAVRQQITRIWHAMFRASPAPPVSSWETIESAPKDGTVFLAWPGHLRNGMAWVRTRWYSHPCVQGWITDEMDCGDYEFKPTHWQPPAVWMAPPPIEETSPEPELEIVPAPGDKRRVTVHRSVPPPIEEERND